MIDDPAGFFTKYLAAPIGGFFVWLIKMQSYRLKDLETRVTTLEKSAAVVEVKIDAIKEDVSEIKEGIKELISRKK